MPPEIRGDMVNAYTCLATTTTYSLCRLILLGVMHVVSVFPFSTPTPLPSPSRDPSREAPKFIIRVSYATKSRDIQKFILRSIGIIQTLLRLGDSLVPLL